MYEFISSSAFVLISICPCVFENAYAASRKWRFSDENSSSKKSENIRHPSVSPKSVLKLRYFRSGYLRSGELGRKPNLQWWLPIFYSLVLILLIFVVNENRLCRSKNIDKLIHQISLAFFKNPILAQNDTSEFEPGWLSDFHKGVKTFLSVTLKLHISFQCVTWFYYLRDVLDQHGLRCMAVLKMTALLRSQNGCYQNGCI